MYTILLDMYLNVQHLNSVKVSWDLYILCAQVPSTQLYFVDVPAIPQSNIQNTNTQCISCQPNGGASTHNRFQYSALVKNLGKQFYVEQRHSLSLV
jgi:hypothetical protein